MPAHSATLAEIGRLAILLRLRPDEACVFAAALLGEAVPDMRDLSYDDAHRVLVALEAQRERGIGVAA